MIKRILVPFDGSAESRSAFNFALVWSKKFKAELYLISVIEIPQPPVDIETEAFIESSKSKYEKLHKNLIKEFEALKFHHFIVCGKAANCIVEAAKEKNIDLIVMGHPTHTGLVRWFIGSTANHVIDHAECSVVVVKDVRDIKNILIGFDGSKEANWAFDSSVDLAKTFKANVHVLSVVWLIEEAPTDEMLKREKERVEGVLDQLHDKAKNKGVDVFTSTRIMGSPARRIADEVKNDRADLLIVGHHSRGMLWRWMVGSVTDHIFDWAQCTVLVVKKDHCKTKV